jgi:hypothetical protein
VRTGINDPVDLSIRVQAHLNGLVYRETCLADLKPSLAVTAAQCPYALAPALDPQMDGLWGALQMLSTRQPSPPDDSIPVLDTSGKKDLVPSPSADIKTKIRLSVLPDQ